MRVLMLVAMRGSGVPCNAPADAVFSCDSVIGSPLTMATIGDWVDGEVGPLDVEEAGCSDWATASLFNKLINMSATQDARIKRRRKGAAQS